MLVKTKGIVIKKRSFGENDSIVTILSDSLGVIEATARGAKSSKTSIGGGVQILVYGDFCLFKGRSGYIINSVDSIEAFYSLREDIVKLSLAGYFCELVNFLSKTGDENAAPLLKLTLNSLYFLQNEKLPKKLLKSIFELRALTIAGFMPNLVCCIECAVYEKELMHFFPLDGILVCEQCLATSTYKNENSILFPVSAAVLSAMRHIVFSEPEKIFSFRINGISLEQLNFITENYTLLHTEAKFNSLDMYHSLSE